jgi:hypothetical protein
VSVISDSVLSDSHEKVDCNVAVVLAIYVSMLCLLMVKPRDVFCIFFIRKYR